MERVAVSTLKRSINEARQACADAKSTLPDFSGDNESGHESLWQLGDDVQDLHSTLNTLSITLDRITSSRSWTNSSEHGEIWAAVHGIAVECNSLLEALNELLEEFEGDEGNAGRLPSIIRGCRVGASKVELDDYRIQIQDQKKYMLISQALMDL